MNRYKFSKRRNLVKYCPCGKGNHDGKFSPFEGFEKYGHCHSCGENFFPDGKSIVEPFVNKDSTSFRTSFLSLKLVEEAYLGDEPNNFITFLRSIFSDEEVFEATQKYLISNWKSWKGVTVLWQIDKEEKVRHGKVMMFNPETGKRCFKKDGSAIITTVESLLKIKGFHLKQCLFGLHQVNGNTIIVALVESEKTAVMMSILKPNIIWLATGGKEGFKPELLEQIKHCKITAFPDKGEYHFWKQKAIDLNKLGFKILVDDWLENLDYPDGSDLADVLINEKKAESYSHNWKPKEDSEFSKGSFEIHQMMQERKQQRLEITKEESYKAIQYCADNDTDTYRL